MAELSGDTEIEVDETTAAAIQRGIQAADGRQVVTSEEVRERVRQWISEFSGKPFRQDRLACYPPCLSAILVMVKLIQRA
jgi:hypothetical protein